MPMIGDDAPDFEASDQNRNQHRLSDERGRWVLLYFYPKDETPGCTIEACAFRDAYAEFQSKAVVWGISADTVESHAAFAKNHKLPFPLLADPDRHILGLYGVGERFAKRVSFLIDPDGKVAQIYDSIQPASHPAQVLEELATMGAE